MSLKDFNPRGIIEPTDASRGTLRAIDSAIREISGVRDCRVTDEPRVVHVEIVLDARCPAAREEAVDRVQDLVQGMRPVGVTAMLRVVHEIRRSLNGPKLAATWADEIAQYPGNATMDAADSLAYALNAQLLGKKKDMP